MKLFVLCFAVLFVSEVVKSQSILIPQDTELLSTVEETVFKSKYLDQLQTSDDIYIDGERYNISKSPLAVFNGYKDIFEGLENKYLNGRKMLFSTTFIGSSESPWVIDKNYSAIWKVVDNKIYLNDIFFPMILGARKEEMRRLFPDNEQYKALEKLIGKKFVKGEHAVESYPVAPYGVIPATWVNGNFLIKKGLKNMEKYKDWEENNKVYKLIIKDGKILSKSQITL